MNIEIFDLAGKFDLKRQLLQTQASRPFVGKYVKPLTIHLYVFYLAHTQA